MPTPLLVVLIVLGSLLFLFLISIPLYKLFFKRVYDIVLSFLALLVLSPFLLILIILVERVLKHVNL